jgi:hypothetical protein
MRNRTNTDPAAAPAKTSVKKKKAKGKRGRKKEKTQISVRIDKAVMDLAYAHIGTSKQRITDYLERGIILAMQQDLKMPPIASQVRFMVSHAKRDRLQGVDAYMIAAAISEIRQLDPVLALDRQHVLDWLETFRATLTEEERQEARDLYGYPEDEDENGEVQAKLA